MSGFIAGQCREQATLFPERLDDYLDEESCVRVVDVFVDTLDLSSFGFKTIPATTGRPSYHPSTMLKLFVYGYLNRIQSSRRLERECNRNVELMWLLSRLSPDFKTIADFRKNNGKAIQTACREFVLLCRKLNLFTDATVAIDGSKFKADINRDLNFTSAKLKYRLKLIDESIEKYLLQIESADRQDSTTAKLRTERLEKNIASLKKEVARLNLIEKQLQESPDKQLSITDPDARSMKTRGTGIVGYNVQAAVDTRHHLIVTHEVTNDTSDRSQLYKTAKATKDFLGVSELKVIADRGYYNGAEILACEQDGIQTFLPKTQTSGNQAKGLFGKRDFIYHLQDDEFECPAGQRAIYRFAREEKGKVIRRYWSSACNTCSLRPKCTTGKYRRISRWEHESILEVVEKRLDRAPNAMKVRRSTVEHPFGTIKSWMGATHFQMRTLKRVQTEMSLHVLSYNMKRVINILGAKALIAAMMA